MFHQNKNDGARWDQSSSDAGFKEEALRLLPQIAKQQAEELWRATKQQLKLSSSQKTSFVNDMMRPYNNRHSSESRAMLAKIEAALMKGPKGPFSSPWLGTGRTRVSNSKNPR